MTTPSPPTERVGRYQLLEPIGIGPSGSVSRAKVFGVAGFERQFAVKRFHPELTATAAMAAGLSAAARAYGSLEHPRIARMSEFGVAQGATFTAVEYVPGLDALRLIAEVRLASGSGAGLAAGGALALVSQAARAVGYAHGRGLTHLGLAPTNVIITADGDIKITDFGILSATLPQRPIDVPRVAQRVPYLAPEQLANEATSAATDVFALGVLAYELVTGTRTFKGDTPQQVAHAIMTGPPPEPPLPRPIVRVLQRCLARSPFERFPDARALADALDAALRVAPVPGTRKDIGAQVKETLDRLAALNEGQMSGVVALHLGTGPVRRLDDGDARRAAPAIGREPDTAHDLASAPYELAPPDPMSPQALAAAGATISDLPRPMTTVPGLPPPPIPVPPGVGPPTVPMAPGPAGTGTLLGMGKSPPAPPAGKSQPGSQAGAPPVPGGVRRPPTRPGFDLEIPVEPTLPRPEMSTESAVHPLDPSELEPFDPDAPDEGDAEYDADPDAAPSRAPSAADEFLDAPTRSVGDAGPGNPRSSRPALPTTYRLDPSSIDTRPIEPITLEPLLGDPDMRPSATPATRPSATPAARPITRPALLSEADEAWSLDEDQALDDLAAGRVPTVPATTGGSAAAPGANRASTPGNPGSSASRPPAPPGNPGSGASRLPTPPGNPGSGLSRLPGPDSSGSGLSRLPASRDGSGDGSGSGLSRLPGPAHEATAADGPQSRTILGFAAPPSAPRTTPSPFSPSPSFAPDPGPTADPRAREDEPEPPLRWPEEASAALPAPSYPGVPEQVSPQPPPGWITAPAAPAPPIPAPASARPRRGALWIPAGVIGAAIVGLAAWQVYIRAFAPARGSTTPIAAVPSDAAVAHAPADAAQVATTPAPADAAQVAHAPADAAQVAHVPADAAQVARPPADATQVAAAPADAARVAAPADAAQVAAAPADAREAVPADATRVAAATLDASATPSDARPAPGDAAQVATVSPAAGDSLTIASTPPGAHVFLDGEAAGVTPLNKAGSAKRHNLALLLAGHDLYIAQVDGHGTFQVPLKEVPPLNGPAGIKVLRCKDQDRYYVFVDGKPTGQTCPTERIGCEVGPHSVEVYDAVSGARRKWDIVVKDTRLSFRVRVDP